MTKAEFMRAQTEVKQRMKGKLTANFVKCLDEHDRVVVKVGAGVLGAINLSQDHREGLIVHLLLQ